VSFYFFSSFNAPKKDVLLLMIGIIAAVFIKVNYSNIKKQSKIDTKIINIFR